MKRRERVDELVLPFWLIQILALLGLIQVDLPFAYKSVMRKTLRCAPTNVDLNKNPWFFLFGECLCGLIEDQDLLDILKSVIP